jgi:hypothetical protein
LASFSKAAVRILRARNLTKFELWLRHLDITFWFKGSGKMLSLKVAYNEGTGSLTDSSVSLSDAGICTVASTNDE